MPEIATTQVMQFHSDALEEGDLQVTGLTGVEQISKPYEFTLELASTKPDIDAADVIQNPAWIGIKQGIQMAGSNERASTTLKIHGVIQSFEQIGKELELVKYRAVLVPKLKRLALTHQSRIFQEKKIPEIIKEVCLDYDIEVDDSKLGSYERRDYVVQYEETDLDFIHRWMQHEGIFYYFAQTEDREKMVLADTPEGYGAMQGNSTFSYKPRNSETSGTESGDSEDAAEDWFKQEVITDIAAKTNMMPEKVILNDYNWEDPQTSLECEAEVHSDGIGIVYKYNSHYHTTTQGDRLAKIRAEEINCREQIFNGRGDSRGFRAGMVFTLEDHYRASMNTDYLLTEVRHTATQAVALGSNAVGATYGNTFVAIPKAKKFRPVFDTPWPQIKGVMHAKVDGADAGTPYAQIDDKGRYKVRMPIDRAGGEGDGDASKYVRKSEPYAGPNQGMHFPLLKNSEVLLTHVDGNPDRPVIAGAMFNADNAAVVSQANTTQNVLATPGGTKFIMDDTVGQPFINLKTKDAKLDMLFDGTDGQEKMCFKSTDKNEIKLHSGDENLKIQSSNANTYMRLGKKADEAEKTAGDVTVTGGQAGFYLTTDGQWNQYTHGDANIIVTGAENKKVVGVSNWTIQDESAEYKYGNWFTFKAALTYGISIGFTADFKLSGGMAIAVGASFNINGSLSIAFEGGAKLEVKKEKVKQFELNGKKIVVKKDREDSVDGKFTMKAKQNLEIFSNANVVIQAGVPVPPADPSLAAQMQAWAAGAVAKIKAKARGQSPAPAPVPLPPLPAPPTPKIEVTSNSITIQVNPTTSIEMGAAGITLKCGASELKVAAAGVTSKPMVQAG
jgi:type VI secretion system secreted protein VgrG